MGADSLTGWTGSLVAATAIFAMASLPGASQAQTKPGGSPSPGVQALARSVVYHAKFMPALQRGVVPADGWPQFLHNELKLKVGAPAPAVPLLGAEWKQWRSDIVTFKFRKLKDRRLLYIYYLSPPESSPKTPIADAVLKAIKAVAAPSAGDPAIWTAIGVEYEIKTMKFYDAEGAKLLFEPELLRWAAVPMKWSEASYEFIKSEHDPATFAALVGAAATALPTGTYANFGAVQHWSALAKKELKGKTVATGTAFPKGMAAAYLKTVSKGPYGWLDMKPVASFIALDRKIDVAGAEPKPVLTSKAAWPATGK